MKLIGLVVLSVALVGCDMGRTARDASAEKRKAKPVPAYRVEHDDVRNVTCWLTGGNRGGVFCMPDWMLKAPEVKP
jgi:hypothetical protein